MTKMLAALMTCLLLAGCAGAQVIGTVDLRTGSQNSDLSVLDGATGAATPFRNINTAGHLVSVCASTAGNTFTAELQSSSDGTVWTAVSRPVTVSHPNCDALVASGYFPYLRAAITSCSAVGMLTACTPTFRYNGLSIPLPLSGIFTARVNSQPVTYVPSSSTFCSSVLAAADCTITSAPAVVTGGFVENTSAAKVYLWTRDVGVASQVIMRMIPANSQIQLELPAGGVTFTSSVGVRCSTSATALADPASGCVIQIHYKPLIVVNNNVDTAGTVQTTTTLPFPQ